MPILQNFVPNIGSITLTMLSINCLSCAFQPIFLLVGDLLISNSHFRKVSGQRTENFFRKRIEDSTRKVSYNVLSLYLQDIKLLSL